MIYFDHAATSLPKPPEVFQAMELALRTFGGSGRGGHQAAMNANRNVFAARVATASLLGSAPDRTVFTANATHSLNIAINGVLGAGDHAICTALDHNSVLRPLYRLQRAGMGLSIVPADRSGELDYDAFEKSLRTNTRAVVCTHASNLTGGVVDLPFISRFCKEHGLLLIVDASQTAGLLPIDADGDGIDVLCFTGHKSLYGPQGTGGLCVRAGLSIEPLQVGGSGMDSYLETHPDTLPEALEAGTRNGPGIAGLLAGLDYVRREGIDNLRSRALSLRQRFVDGVSRLADVTVYGERSRPHVATVALNIGTLDASLVSDRLADEHGICVRSGAHCAPLAHEALGTRKQGAVRFSFAACNSEEEIDKGIAAIEAIAEEA